MLTVEEVGSITRLTAKHERYLLAVVRKGYQSKSTDNPYSQMNFRNAWCFGNQSSAIRGISDNVITVIVKLLLRQRIGKVQNLRRVRT